MRKVPSIAISSTGTYDLFHTTNDTLDFVSIDKIEEVIRLTLDLVMSVLSTG
jgi:aminopeptidase-like protein